MKKYGLIYADPPWRYEQKSLSGAAEKQYQTMSDEELYALPVDTITDKDCVLFLWTTFPKLKEALELIEAWGFHYRTIGFVWVKQNKSGVGYFFGLGFWTRGNAEICLLAVKGKPRRMSAKVSQLIVSPLERHSKKPDETRERIVELLGDIPRIELFARERFGGWDCFGNEVDGDIIYKGGQFHEQAH